VVPDSPKGPVGTTQASSSISLNDPLADSFAKGCGTPGGIIAGRLPLDANYRHGGQTGSFAQVLRADGSGLGRSMSVRLLHFGAALPML
jgi:hypothetical protein